MKRMKSSRFLALLLALCCATLGKTILRTETAGMAALAMVMYELEL